MANEKSIAATIALPKHNKKESRSIRHDPLTRKERSERMSRIKSKDTSPELMVRKLIHGMGYRYRLHAKDLPGCPDIVFRPRKKIIFVHGCFWHQHGCNHYRMPKSRKEFWEPKLLHNVERDKKTCQELLEKGWNVLTIWECQLKDQKSIKKIIRAFLK